MSKTHLTNRGLPFPPRLCYHFPERREEGLRPVCIMKYENARDIFPPELLREIQSYVSGKLVYIPAAEKRGWGETTGYRRQLAERNRDIRQAFSHGVSIEALAEVFSLSIESIRRIVYTKKEDFFMDYACTLTNARQAAAQGELENWIHTYLLTDGDNKPFSDGLKELDRIYYGPVVFPLNQFTRNTGPEPEMRWKIHPGWFEIHVGQLMDAVKANADLPPLIVHYCIPEGKTDGEFEMNDGNHRLEAFNRLGVETYSVIFWCTEQHEYDQLMERYGHLMGPAPV